MAIRAGARRRTTERLSWQDRANLAVESGDTPMHMAFLGVFEPDGQGGTDDLLPRLRAHVRGRMERLPALRRVLVRHRLPVGAATWVERDVIDVDRHVRTLAVSTPGGERELLEAASTLLMLPLDRSLPLWEIWLLTGLRSGGFAILVKLHHAVTDGIGLLRVAESLLDGSPAPAPSGNPPASSPAALSVLGAGLRAAAAPWLFAITLTSAARTVWAGQHLDLNHPIGSRRRLRWVHLRLADLRRVAHERGVKVNDVLLDLVSAGVGEAVWRRTPLPASPRIRALIAVTPPASDAGVRRNRSGSVLVSLPLGTARTPPELSAVARATRRARRWQHPLVLERSLVVVAAVRLGRVLSRHQHSVDIAVSNLVGPPGPLYLLGRRMVSVLPVAPISGNVTIDFCAASYNGQISVGVLAEADAWPDIDVVAGGMRDAARRVLHDTPRKPQPAPRAASRVRDGRPGPEAAGPSPLPTSRARG